MTSFEPAKARQVDEQPRSADREPAATAHRQHPASEGNDTRAEFPADQCIHDLFEAQAERSPDRVAVVGEDGQLTYAELNRRANQLAHFLRQRGVGPGIVVGICVERSLEMVVGLLGIIKAGGAYLPLDPAYPAERLSFMLSDAQAPWLLTQQQPVERFTEQASQIVLLDSDWGSISQEAETNPRRSAAPEHLAYLIYTSGSTGKPKGVQVPHRAVVNLLVAMRNELELDENDKLLAVTTLSFDISVLELFLPLTVGARVVIAPREVATDGARLSRKLVQCGATLMQATPATWQILLASEWQGSDRLKILCGGETLSPDLASRLLTKGAGLWNLYGPTETTVWSTIYKVAEVDGAIPIGHPLANTQVYLLDSESQLVPPGEPGELCIGGMGVTRGYLNRPELTAEKFIRNPFSSDPRARIYRTGDVARFLPDGNLAFLGRIDHQVKIRGYRIELGEIEAVLSSHPAVKQGVAVCREDDPGDRRIVAYVVLGPNEAPQTNALRSRLQQQLPDYMIPAAFVFLEGFPLTPNGKVDRAALPAPDRARPKLGQPFVAAGTQVEQVIAAIWGETLGFDQIGVHDNFFELGGHSLKATQIITRLRDALHVELPLARLFQCPTVAQLAASVDEDRKAGRTAPPARIPMVDRNIELPLSFSQERVWFLQRLDPENIAYNFQCALRFTGPLDRRALERSLSEIVRRHEIYRTTFPAVEGRPVQRIHPAEPVKLPIVDLRGLPENERESQQDHLMERELPKQFDVSRLPLVRWILLRLDDAENVLLHFEHHLVHDGWSFNVFLQELLKLYKAFSRGQPSPLPPLTVQFADFAHWQRQWMRGPEARHQLDYWQKQLQGCPPTLDLPTDRSRPSVHRFRGAAPRAEIPLSLCRSLREFSRRESVSLFMTMAAAFAALLHRYSRQEDIPIGSGIANRRWRETESMIGMVINNVVLRANLAGDPTFRELLTRMRDVTLQASAHQDLPFDMIVESLQPQRHLSHNPLFQVMFAFHDAPTPQVDLPGLNLDMELVLSNGSAKFDMTVIVIPHCEQRLGLRRGSEEDGLTVIWEYNSDVFEESTIRRMIDHFLTLLEAVVADPGQHVSQLRLLAESQRRRLLHEWNHTSTNYPHRATIPELFEAQVGRSPDAIAVDFEGSTLSYRQLNRRANQLAHYLGKRGVGPETMVGICVHRSLEMVVGILGILKAGGAYVPLDPEYPEQRLSLMLDETQAPVLLTQRHLVKNLPDHHAKMVCLDTDWPSVARESDQDPVGETGAQNLAYVMYTSGSTGKPKGTRIVHRGVVRLVTATNYVELGPTEVFLQLAPISFDASTFELWGSLLHGARLVVLPPGKPSLEELGEFIRRKGITTLWLTATLFHQMVDHQSESLRTVRQLLAGGEELSVPHVEKMLRLLGEDARLINGYGPTENTTFTCCHVMTASSRVGRSVPIGRPISNTRVYILDRHMQPTPVGVPGELYIGGDGLARDYLHRPELTAARFVEDPFREDEASRLYRTGDLCRWLADGTIEFLGRQDRQVKVRGFRVELGEIEATLAEHPAVREAVAAIHEDVPGDKGLVAYVVHAGGAESTAGQLREFLREKLPAYMVPSAIVRLDALPLLPSGKVDRQALPAPDRDSRSDRAFVAPSSDAERMVAAIWSEVLGVERIGMGDDFFELGGHSLLATQVVSRLWNVFGVKLPLTVVFERPTPAALAEFITTTLWAARGGEAVSGTDGDGRQRGEI